MPRNKLIPSIVLGFLMSSALVSHAAEYKHKTPVHGLLPPGSPYISISPFNVQFPPTPVGQSSSTIVTVTNPDSYSALLNLRSVLDSGLFTFTANSCGTSASPVNLAPSSSCSTTITFTPTSVGSFTGTFAAAADNSSNGIQSKLMFATATGQATISETDSTNSFASVYQGDSHAYPLTFKNVGNIASTGTFATVSGLQFSLGSNSCGTESSPVSLLPNQDCSVTILGSSLDAGSFSGVVGIYSNGSPTPAVTRNLSLDSMALNAIASVISGAPVLFGDVVQGTTAPSATVTVKNNGNMAMTLTGVTGLPSEVTLTGNTCVSVSPAASCSLSFTLSTAAPVVISNTTVTTVGGTSNASFVMSGTVVAATSYAATSNGVVNFGSVVYDASNTNAVNRTVNVTNTGNSALTVNTVSGLPAGTVFQSNTCSNVPVNGTCALVFRMSSDGTTSFTNSPIILNGPTNQDAITLTGSVVAPTSVASVVSGSPISFGSVVQGATAPTATVNITNTGNSPLTISNTLTSAPAAVSITANSCSSVAPSGSCALTFTMSTSSTTSFSGATPTTTGATSNATISMSGSVVAATSIATITSGNPVSFGSVAQNTTNPTATVVIKNTGNSNMTLTGMAGLPSAVTANVSACSAIIPNASCNVVLTMSTANVTTFSNTVGTTAGATDNANITVSGTVTDSFAASDVFVAPLTETTTYTDTSKAASYITNGNVAISSNRQLFGKNTATFDGNGDYVRYATSGSNLMFPSGTAFTMEGWVYIAADSSPDAEGARGFTIASLGQTSNANTPYVEFSIGGSTTTTGTSLYMWSDSTSSAAGANYTFSKNTWYHVAITRNTSNLVTFYVNGVNIGTATWAVQVGYTSAFLNMGGRNSTSNHYKYLNGNLSNIRFTKGAVRYTSNFTPPNAPF